jgi:hypothetical protein
VIENYLSTADNIYPNVKKFSKSRTFKKTVCRLFFVTNGLKSEHKKNVILLLIFVLKFPASDNNLSLSVDVDCMVRKVLSSLSKFGVLTTLVSNKLNSFCKNSFQTLLLSLKLKFEQLTLLLWHFIVHLTMSYRQLQ